MSDKVYSNETLDKYTVLQEIEALKKKIASLPYEDEITTLSTKITNLQATVESLNEYTQNDITSIHTEIESINSTITDIIKKFEDLSNNKQDKISVNNSQLALSSNIISLKQPINSFPYLININSKSDFEITNSNSDYSFVYAFTDSMSNSENISVFAIKDNYKYGMFLKSDTSLYIGELPSSTTDENLNDGTGPFYGIEIYDGGDEIYFWNAGERGVSISQLVYDNQYYRHNLRIYNSNYGTLFINIINRSNTKISSSSILLNTMKSNEFYSCTGVYNNLPICGIDFNDASITYWSLYYVSTSGMKTVSASSFLSSATYTDTVVRIP